MLAFAKDISGSKLLATYYWAMEKEAALVLKILIVVYSLK
jgi:hypothetical protein